MKKLLLASAVVSSVLAVACFVFTFTAAAIAAWTLDGRWANLGWLSCAATVVSGFVSWMIWSAWSLERDE